MLSLRKKMGLQFLVSNAETVVNFALSIILARMLTPTDIGIFSMSAILISFAHVFRDFGVFSFLIKEKEVTEQTIRSAFGVLLVSSWSVAAVLYVSASLWSGFFRVPEVEDVVRVLALGFVFIPFGSIPYALLTRNLEVQRTSKVKLISMVTYASTTIALAYTGHGHMTMAWANLVSILVSGVAYHWYSTTRIPWIPSLAGWRRITHFGAGTMVTSTVSALDTALPDVMLGRMSTPASVGFFNKAASAVALPYTVLQSTINYFALPYLSRIHHANNDMADAIHRASAHLCVIIIPIMAWTTVMGREVILFLFGNQWVPSIAVIPWLCIAGAVAVMFQMVSPALTSIGKPYVPALPLLMILSAKVTIGILIFDRTLVSFGMALAAGQLVGIPVYLLLLKHYFRISIRRWLFEMGRILLIAAIAGGSCYLLKASMPADFPIILDLMVNGTAFVVIWLSCVWLLKPPIAEELRRIIGPVARQLGIKSTP